MSMCHLSHIPQFYMGVYMYKYNSDYVKTLYVISLLFLYFYTEQVFYIFKNIHSDFIFSSSTFLACVRVVQKRVHTLLSNCTKSMRNPNKISGYPLGMGARAMDFSAHLYRLVLLAGTWEWRGCIVVVR